jgi:hypothetical protein
MDCGLAKCAGGIRNSMLRLRQNLAEVMASRSELRKEMDDLRRDRDHWRELADPAKPKLEGTGQKTWFCGRASAGASEFGPSR